MPEVVIFGVGSPLVVDVQASLHRAGVTLSAGIKNHSGESYLLEPAKVVEVHAAEEFINHPFLVPLFTPAHRQQAVRHAQSFGFTTPYSLIDPTVPSLYCVKHQPGLYINSGCTLGAACEIDEFVLLNRGASIGHHARIGRFVAIGPRAVIAGQVTIEEGAVIGAGAVILPKISLGKNSVVAAGAVVTESVPANCLVAGVPAHIVKRAIAGFGGKGID